MELKLKPLADRVVVKPIEQEEKTKGGVYLPDTATKEKPQEGTVLAVGPGRLMDDGTRSVLEVQPGDRVLFAKYAGTEFKDDDGDKFIILNEKDILAIIEK
jgi:chaperonin GroES